MKPPFSYGFPMIFPWFSYGKTIRQAELQCSSSPAMTPCCSAQLFSRTRFTCQPWPSTRASRGANLGGMGPKKDGKMEWFHGFYMGFYGVYKHAHTHTYIYILCIYVYMCLFIYLCIYSFAYLCFMLFFGDLMGFRHQLKGNAWFWSRNIAGVIPVIFVVIIQFWTFGRKRPTPGNEEVKITPWEQHITIISEPEFFPKDSLW